LAVWRARLCKSAGCRRPRDRHQDRCTKPSDLFRLAFQVATYVQLVPGANGQATWILSSRPKGAIDPPRGNHRSGRLVSAVSGLLSSPQTAIHTFALGNTAQQGGYVPNSAAEYPSDHSILPASVSVTGGSNMLTQAIPAWALRRAVWLLVLTAIRRLADMIYRIRGFWCVASEGAL